MIGVSPEFALSRMDEVHHPECELYVEDEVAKTLLMGDAVPEGSRFGVTNAHFYLRRGVSRISTWPNGERKEIP